MNREEGKKFLMLIQHAGLTAFKFACRTEYSQTRIYNMIKGNADLRSLTVAKAIKFAKVLGFVSLDEFYNACGIDLVND